MKGLKKTISFLLFTLLLLPIISLSTRANSAQSWWTGTDTTGAIITNEDCPLIVEHELLTFDINDFPQGHYFSLDEFLAYSGKVTAEYTFYNPADYKVDATLVFPFGNVPDYGIFYDSETGNYAMNGDTHKYDITINGDTTEKTLRHTLSLHGAKFNLEKDLPKLCDTYLKDNFYAPDLTVHKYTYIPKDVDKKTFHAATACIYINTDNMKTRIYMENQCGGSVSSLDKGVRIDTWVDLEKDFSVYVIGEPLDHDLDWKFYSNGACEEEIEGKMELLNQSTLSFKEFALSRYKDNSGILEHDWYNAVVELFNYYAWACGALHSTEIDLDITDQLMRWYEYDISLEPGERIVNAVTAPIYPSIRGDYEPPVYEYTYLLSPAKSWKEFGNLDILLNTPYYMIESGPEGFEYVNPGYELHLTGLPEGELVFKLSENRNPKIPFHGFRYIMNSYFGFPVIAICFVLLLLFLVKGIDKACSKKKTQK